jgi:hypothetical protein
MIIKQKLEFKFEKVNAIQNHYKNNGDDDFNIPEKFIRQITSLPSYELCIDVMKFLEDFEDLNRKLQESFDKYNQVCQVLLENESLKELIGLILNAGNHLNKVIIDYFIFRIISIL